MAVQFLSSDKAFNWTELVGATNVVDQQLDNNLIISQDAAFSSQYVQLISFALPESVVVEASISEVRKDSSAATMFAESSGICAIDKENHEDALYHQVTEEQSAPYIKTPEASCKSSEETTEVIIAAPVTNPEFVNRRYQKRKHPKVLLKDGKYLCNFCNLALESYDSLQSHENTHSGDPAPYKCDICGKKFKQKSYLKTHKEEVHEGKRRHFICSICDRIFTRSNLLKAHIRKGHSKPSRKCRTPKSSVTRPENQDGTKLLSAPKNDICMQGFPKFARCKKKCPVCSKEFKHMKHLNRHRLKHSEQHHKKCQHCDKTFYRNDDLRKHVDGHFNVKRFKSKYCDLTFRQIRNQKYHEKQHEESNFCNRRRFNQQLKLVKKCKLCSEACLTPFVYKEHLRTAHLGSEHEVSVPLDSDGIKENENVPHAENRSDKNTVSFSNQYSNSNITLPEDDFFEFLGQESLDHRRATSDINKGIKVTDEVALIWSWDEEEDSEVSAQVNETVEEYFIIDLLPKTKQKENMKFKH